MCSPSTVRKHLSTEKTVPTAAAPNVHVMPQTNQVRGLHTIIRNREVERDDFVFYSERLLRLLMEFASSFLPYEPVEVSTLCGRSFVGHFA